MPKVEVKFLTFSAFHNAAPGDVKKIEAEYVPELERGGAAEVTSKAEAKKAGLEGGNR